MATADGKDRKRLPSRATRPGLHTSTSPDQPAFY